MSFIQRNLIWFLILFFGVWYGTFSVVRHLRLETYIFDLGYYDQLIWEAAHFKPIYSSVLESLPWVDHVSLSIYLLTPLYWIWSSPLTLLIFQAFFVCLGAYPIYLLSLKKTRNYLFSIVLSFSYLMFYGLQNAVAFDFHAVTLGPTLLAYIFWFYEEKRYKIFFLFLIIFVGLQENFFVLTAALGVFLILKYRDFKRGLPITVVSLLVFVSLIFYIIPHFFGANYYYLSNGLEGFSFSSLIHKLYSPSSKIDVVVFSFLGFGGLVILSPVFWVILLEEFLGRFLLTNNPNWWILGFQYNAILAPILAFASIEAYKNFLKKRTLVAVALLILGVFISQVRVKTDVWKVFKPGFYIFTQAADAKKVISEIPSGASVAATNDLGAQIAERQGLIFLTNCVDNSEAWGPDSKRCFKLQPEYLLANLDPNGSVNNFYPDYSRDSILSYFNYVLKNGKYRLVTKSGWVYLLKKS